MLQNRKRVRHSLSDWQDVLCELCYSWFPGKQKIVFHRVSTRTHEQKHNPGPVVVTCWEDLYANKNNNNSHCSVRCILEQERQVVHSNGYVEHQDSLVPMAILIRKFGLDITVHLPTWHRWFLDTIANLVFNTAKHVVVMSIKASSLRTPLCEFTNLLALKLTYAGNSGTYPLQLIGLARNLQVLYISARQQWILTDDVMKGWRHKQLRCLTQLRLEKATIYNEEDFLLHLAHIAVLELSNCECKYNFVLQLPNLVRCLLEDPYFTISAIENIQKFQAGNDVCGPFKSLREKYHQLSDIICKLGERRVTDSVICSRFTYSGWNSKI